MQVDTHGGRATGVGTGRFHRKRLGAGRGRASVRPVGHGWGRRLFLLLCGLLLAAGAAACSRAVEGRPVAAPPAPGPVPAAGPAETAPGARDPTTGAAPSVERPAAPPSSPPSDRPTRPPAAPGRPPALEADVLADECLLNSAQLAALLGTPVRAPEQTVVRRDDGSRSSGCSVTAKGDPAPLAAINVYRVRTGTAEQFVRAGAGGGRVVGAGRAGRAAVVLDTATGPTLQVAGARFLVTVVVHGRAPADDAWRAAARAALARLPA